MIPEEKKAAVNHALNMAFGVSEFEEIQEMTAGLSSARIYRILISGKPYLLRIIMRTDAMGDPTIHFACMKAGADAGIAPHVWYAGIEDRIAITDFIDAKPFPMDAARIKMPDIIKRLHALPAFPFRLNYLDFVDKSIVKFQEAQIIPDHITRDIFTEYEKISDIYPRTGPDLVSCHNDLKPENVLYDGERVWLVDWEGAFLNDRYLDLAVVANFVVTNDGQEMDFLKRYFGKEASEYQLARFFLMQQILHMAYFVFLLTISTHGKSIDPDFMKEDFREFHNLMWGGKITLETDEVRQRYALVHMEQLRLNFKRKRFEKSLKIVSDHK